MFAKKDIPARGSSVYRSRIRVWARRQNRNKSTKPPWKHARGQKQIAPTVEKEMHLRARKSIRRHNRAATANTGEACIDFSRLHTISKMLIIPAWRQCVRPVGSFSARKIEETFATFNGVNQGDIPC